MTLVMAAASSSKRRRKPCSGEEVGGGEMRKVSTSNEDDDARAPLEMFYEMLGGQKAARARCEELTKASFRQPTAAETSGYTVALLHTVQNCASEDDLVRIPIEARNKFGVTLLHKACRYPNWVAARYIATRLPRLTSATDDLGRLPLHDACWNENVDFAVIDILITQEPATLLSQDNRGHTPLCYVPRKAWAQWNAFFRSRHHALVAAFGIVVSPKRELTAAPDEEDNDDSETSSSSSSSSLSSDESGWESAWIAARHSRSLEFYNSERAKRQRIHESSSPFASSGGGGGSGAPGPAAKKPRCWTIKQVLSLGDLTSSSSSSSLSVAPEDDDDAANSSTLIRRSSSCSAIPDFASPP